MDEKNVWRDTALLPSSIVSIEQQKSIRARVHYRRASNTWLRIAHFRERASNFASKRFETLLLVAFRFPTASLSPSLARSQSRRKIRRFDSSNDDLPYAYGSVIGFFVAR